MTFGVFQYSSKLEIAEKMIINRHSARDSFGLWTPGARWSARHNVILNLFLVHNVFQQSFFHREL